jgi:DNA-binding protein H-NS
VASYKELQAQIAELQVKAEEAREDEIKDAITQIKDLMNSYGISADDLLGQKDGSSKTLAKKKTAIQFRDGDKTWSGRGRGPNWLKGKDKETFRVK